MDSLGDAYHDGYIEQLGGSWGVWLRGELVALRLDRETAEECLLQIYLTQKKQMIRRRPIPRSQGRSAEFAARKELMEGLIGLVILFLVICALIALGGSQYGG